LQIKGEVGLGFNIEIHPQRGSGGSACHAISLCGVYACHPARARELLFLILGVFVAAE
jgi:hypothetical protein